MLGKKKESIRVNAVTTIKIIAGHGRSNSAASGERIVKVRATILQIPIAVFLL
jgi:hypothetical protein